MNMAGRGYIDQANSQMLVVALLEHAVAIENLDGILAVEGIHAVYVGPQDMSMSLGLPGQPGHPTVQEMDARVREAAKAAGKRYATDRIVADRASNFFLNGIGAFLDANKDRLS